MCPQSWVNSYNLYHSKLGESIDRNFRYLALTTAVSVRLACAFAVLHFQFPTKGAAEKQRGEIWLPFGGTAYLWG
ncbi:hypothetical protein J6590_027824 [Homalodisca vitripennis]|nr:hypothetical protein J6590_027824 [Homalodisca vitripennis]